jgi:subtilisin family serine protease
MKRHAFAAGIMAAVILASCTKEVQTETTGYDEQPIAGNAALAAEEQIPPGGHMPNEVLVKFKRGTSATARQQALERMSARVKEHILTKAMERFGDNEGVYLLHTPLEVMSAVAQMRVLGEVEYAEPNYVYTHNAISNDTYSGNLWGMQGDASSPANQYGSQAAEAWARGNTGQASEVYIGIIDEGVMYSHDDLIDNMAMIPGEVPGNGADDDGNGYVDDVYGWDFDANDNTTYDGSSDDHGTHVAGTIGAKGGNGKGVAGVTWNVKILTAKFLGRRGGTTANAIKAVDYFTYLKVVRGLNIVATNNSWGGGGYSKALEEAINNAGAAGILFIAAAGNDGRNIETTKSYPSGYASSNIIAVASITSTGGLSSFSNYASTMVDIGAPGSSIYSTIPDKRGTGSAYASYSGTSMATPHVTGAAALYAASHTGASAVTIKNAILSSAVPTGSLAGRCVTGGRLNVSGF